MLWDFGKWFDVLMGSRRSRDVDSQMRGFAAALQELVKSNEANAKRLQALELEKQHDQLIDIQSKLFDKVATYNNVVVTLGYAGFFAIWNYVSTDLGVADTRLVAIMLGCSLFLFVGWVVVGSFQASQLNIGIAKVLNDPSLTPFERQEKLEAVQLNKSKSQLRYFAVWYWVFYCSAGLGFFAGGYLLLLLLLRIVGIEFGIQSFLDSLKR
ncbi:hypothetical protein KX928_04925 [Roseobacter sp. YSTF-M11]|uniref:Uncharacterized protein n=1 Tax=Roseobacter insulae TaxID=2859783 RepID=A0A9X1FST8_9RHOB|nr:hypothetical protein [Roseobacter insulae]MBW4707124.1 hypothetical protein [Roseobacter insulae]